MSAITQCRTAALGGHVLRCDGCGLDQVSYNSCRNRHCPKCQSSAAKRWLDARQADLLPVEYYHVVFTLPAPIADIAYQNKAALYGLLFDVAAETLLRIAADPKHLGASIGATLVLHTWGSALTHHPHVHGIVPGGGLPLSRPTAYLGVLASAGGNVVRRAQGPGRLEVAADGRPLCQVCDREPVIRGVSDRERAGWQRDRAVTFSSRLERTKPCTRVQGLDFYGSPTWARTRDLRINSPALYRLSYRGTALKYSLAYARLYRSTCRPTRQVLGASGNRYTCWYS